MGKMFSNYVPTNRKMKKTNVEGDGFYSSATPTENIAEDFYRKYIELQEKLKKHNIDVEDDKYVEEEEVDEDCDCLSPMYDCYEECKVDLLSLPVYYHIAFAIPADLSLGSDTARRVNAYYNLLPKIRELVDIYEDECEDLEEGWIKAGDTIATENVYVMFTTNKKYQRPTLDSIRSCVRKIAADCFENNIQYVAMPRIGCGHGHLDWEVVKEAILDEFDNYYYDIGEEDYRPFITFCYQ